MKFSMRHVGLLVVWIAFLASLTGQIRYEAVSRIWALNAAPNLVWMVNVAFMLLAVLMTIAITDARRRLFWGGCSMVAVTLVLIQAADLKSFWLFRMLANQILVTVTPEEALMDRVFKEGHVMQLASVLAYSLTPILSLIGGWFTVWKRDQSSQV